MKHNVYFDGAVQSLAFAHRGGQATIGVMEPGVYEFTTGAPERMQIVAGDAEYKRGDSDWIAAPAGAEFSVPGNASFQIRMNTQVAYVCWFG